MADSADYFHHELPAQALWVRTTSLAPTSLHLSQQVISPRGRLTTNPGAGWPFGYIYSWRPASSPDQCIVCHNYCRFML